jgi:Tol biopolymer transport system component
MFTIGNVDNPNSYIDAQIAIQSLESGDRHILDIKGEMARYIEPGYLIVARNGRLLAAPFSLGNSKTLKPLVSVVNDVDGDEGSGISYFSLSASGNLVYIPGTRDDQQQLVWITRDGNVDPLPLPPNSYSNPRISPDGKMIAVNIGRLGSFNEDIWIYDISQALFNRFTFGRGNFYPVWRNDGAGIYYNSIQNQIAKLNYKSFDGTSSKTILEFSTNITQYPISVSPDDKHLILNRLGGVNEGDIFIVKINSNEEPEYLLNEPFFESDGDFSPDGKYLTYSANETGRSEIYIRTFPDNHGKWQVSTEGGFSPKWSEDGKELFYVNNVGKMLVVPIKNEPFFTPGKAKILFDVAQMNFPSYPVANFDIGPDGKRFLMVKNTGYQTKIRAFNIITNWLNELAERFLEDT